jgi:hypothetical protein
LEKTKSESKEYLCVSRYAPSQRFLSEVKNMEVHLGVASATLSFDGWAYYDIKKVKLIPKKHLWL